MRFPQWLLDWCEEAGPVSVDQLPHLILSTCMLALSCVALGIVLGIVLAS